MTIDGIGGANPQAGRMGMSPVSPAEDSFSRSIQNKIAQAQKQLQELSSKEEMPLEEKMKRRQEIQQQISELNMQLRQHEMELRREQQQAKAEEVSDSSQSTRTGRDGDVVSISQEGMAAMISAGSSLKQAKAQGSVATDMEGRADVLEAEIKQDGSRGVDTQRKEEELAGVRQKAQAAQSSRLSTLADAGEELKEAAEEDGEEEQEDNPGDRETEKAGEGFVK